MAEFLRTHACDDVELQNLVQSTFTTGMTIFVESPTQCQFFDSVQAALQIDWFDIWQLRMFDASFELASRRLEFKAPGKWGLRTLGTDLIGDSAWSTDELACKVSTSQMALYGTYKTVSGDDSPYAEPGFFEDRYRKMESVAAVSSTQGGAQQGSRKNAGRIPGLAYPGPAAGAWEHDGAALLTTKIYHEPQGDLIRWVEFKQQTKDQR